MKIKVRTENEVRQVENRLKRTIEQYFQNAAQRYSEEQRRELEAYVLRLHNSFSKKLRANIEILDPRPAKHQPQRVYEQAPIDEELKARVERLQAEVNQTAERVKYHRTTTAARMHDVVEKYQKVQENVIASVPTSSTNDAGTDIFQYDIPIFDRPNLDDLGADPEKLRRTLRDLKRLTNEVPQTAQKIRGICQVSSQLVNNGASSTSSSSSSSVGTAPPANANANANATGAKRTKTAVRAITREKQ